MLGIAASALILLAAVALRSPLGQRAQEAGDGALAVLLFFAQMGMVAAAIGFALGLRPLAWIGCAALVAMAIALDIGWMAMPLALVPLACVVGWEALEPRPRPVSRPPGPPPVQPWPAWPMVGHPPAQGGWAPASPPAEPPVWPPRLP